jgi:2-polyprenyl-6-methoxyphenol hydroxylase-like FAD-dependent oxidoreductase
MQISERIVIDIQETTCCIVGGGPAGAVLALLLARQGISVTLLEAHKNFDRDFRGDTIHAGVMEIVEELGLANRLLQEIPHNKTSQIQFVTPDDAIAFADFGHLNSHHPYITIISQVDFLEFVIAEAKRYPNFQLVMGANVQQLIEEHGKISGVRYRGQGGWHEVRAELTIGADGRFSSIRQLAGIDLIQAAPPIDILWFRLPRHPEEPKGLKARFSSGRVLVQTITPTSDKWQIGYIIPKGYYQQLRTVGIEALQKSLVEVVPEFSDRVEQLKDWKQASLLTVVVGRVSRWYRPGLLLIGDAAHVLSPIGGVGINYAIQDAVVAANTISEPLKAGHLRLTHLAQVQHKRQHSIQIIQAFQSFIQSQITVRALQSKGTFKLPFYMRLPLWRNLLARLLAYGISPPHVKQ